MIRLTSHPPTLTPMHALTNEGQQANPTRNAMAYFYPKAVPFAGTSTDQTPILSGRPSPVIYTSDPFGAMHHAIGFRTWR